mgnify:CR=1 FL=1
MPIADLAKELKTLIAGDLAFDDAILTAYSHDASLFEVKPTLVVFPKHAADIQAIVRCVSEHKREHPELSVTVRAAGTCMSGGSLNESIILDTTRYMQGIISLTPERVTLLPGTFYRDLEVETLKLGVILPCYTASKNLCAVGGMIGNNSAGEKTLSYGKMEDYVEELRVIFADGNEYTVRALTPAELEQKCSQKTFEGEVYRRMKALIDEHRDLITQAKPKVSKNSAGYYLWNIWNGDTFNLCKLIVGAQGTLGIATQATLKLVPIKRYMKLAVIFMRDISPVGGLIKEILTLKPESIESYDDSTLKLALRFFPEMLKQMKPKHFFRLMFSFIPEVLIMLRHGPSKLMLLIEFADSDVTVIHKKLNGLSEIVRRYHLPMRIAHSEEESEKYWTVRRESFNLLRKHVKGKRTAPFIDDVVVDPQYMAEFLPEMRKILDTHKLFYTIAGHAGNGNFHIIPLMDMKDRTNIDAIRQVSDEVYALVAKYHGSITGEHNDGIIRTPYLDTMYSPQILDLFRKTKDIFDPLTVFNPGKKVGITREYVYRHIA